MSIGANGTNGAIGATGVTGAQEAAGGTTSTLPIVTVLPTAASSNRGAQYLLQGAAGLPDTVYVCIKLGNGAYDFVQMR